MASGAKEGQMTSLLLLVVFFGDATTWSTQQWLTRQAGNEVVLYGLSQQTTHTRKGQQISLYANGLLTTSENQLWWSSFDQIDQEPVLLPSTGDTPLPFPLPNLHMPGFVSANQLWVFQQEQWFSVALPAWFEYRQPRPMTPSYEGFQPLPPHVFSFADHIWLYQPKNGKLVVWQPNQPKPKQLQVPEKMVPVRAGTDLFWVGAPKKGKLGLASRTDQYALDDVISVNDLSRHSLTLATDKGIWLLTFDEGWRAATRSWDKGTVTVTAYFARRQGKKLKISRHSLGQLPVNFTLTTSASGSPKLKVDPAFAVKAVSGRTQLVIAHGKKLMRLSPEGRKRFAHLTVPPKDILATVPTVGGITLISPTGAQFHPWSE